MVTENVNIVFRESGIRVIKRNLDELGQSANNATRGIFLLQRALFVLGGAGILRGLASQLDLLTSYENRLKLTTTSARNLQAVQDSLFDIAVRSRTSFEGVNEIYNRTALSARSLGRSQSELLRFTESVSKAAVVSGASAREANAALIQLGQGIASNRLGGDELRSILEQLPFVADVIAEYLTSTGKFGQVGRGELRKLGTEGKLTADIILDAFKNSSTQIDAAFAKLTPTIDGSAEVFRTKWLQALDTFDDTFAVSETVAKGILLVADNIGLLITLASSAAAVLASMFVGSVINGIMSYVNGLRATSVQQTAVLNRLVAIRNATVLKTQATLAANAAEVRSAEIDLVRIRQNTILAQQAVIQAAADVNTQRAISLQTGSYLALVVAKGNLATATSAVVSLQAAEAAGAARLGAAQGLAAGATTLAGQAQGRLAVAQAAQASIGARLVAQLPLLAASYSLVATTVSGLFAILLANPLTIFIATLVLAIGWILAFGENIKLTADGVVSLRDAAIASFQLIVEGAKRLASDFFTFLQPAIEFIRGSWITVADAAFVAFSGINTFITSVFNVIVGTVVGFVNGTVRAFDILPAAVLDVFNLMRNNIIDAMEGTANAILEAFYGLPEKIGSVFESISTFASSAVTFVVDAFRALPGAISALAGQAAQFLKNKFFAAINEIVGLLNQLPGISIAAFGEVSDAAEGIDFSLPSLPDFSGYVKDGLVDLQSLKGDISGAASEAGSIYGEEFTKAYSRDFAGEIGKSVIDSITPIGDAIIERSRQNLQKQAAEDLLRQKELDGVQGAGTDAGAGAGGGGGGGGGTGKDFAKILSEMKQELDILNSTNASRVYSNELSKIEKDLKRSLTDEETKLAQAMIQKLEVAKMEISILEEIVGPRQKAIDQQQAINNLYASGAITAREFTEAIRESQIAADKASGTFFGGFRASINESIQTMSEFGQSFGGEFVGFIDKASGAIAEFSKTGKINIREVFQEFIGGLLKISINRTLMGIATSIFPNFANFANIPGFATGGQFMVGGRGPTDSQLVSFMASPDERVTVETPAQRKRADKAMESGNGSVIAPTNNYYITVKSDTPEQFKNSARQLRKSLSVLGTD